MCYNVHANLKSQIKRAKQKGSTKELKGLEQELAQFSNHYHVSGFSHPKLLVYPNTTPFHPTPMTWGLVPHWIKSEHDKVKFWNNTLNCRSESMFEKPSFKDSALQNRCLLYVDGFFEYHHHNGKKYPFYVYSKDHTPLCFGGLWSEWLNPATGELEKSFSIVTTSGNALLSKIHNNPKLEGPRMPVILNEEKANDWLNTQLSRKELVALIIPYPDENMAAHTVGQILGKGVQSNTKEVLTPVEYDIFNPTIQNRTPELFD